jgi:hypothetical protein
VEGQDRIDDGKSGKNLEKSPEVAAKASRRRFTAWRAPQKLIHLLRRFTSHFGQRRLSMTSKIKRRSPEQIVRAIQEGEAMLAGEKPLAEVLQKLEISEATWLRWKNQ